MKLYVRFKNQRICFMVQYLYFFLLGQCFLLGGQIKFLELFRVVQLYRQP